MQYFFFWCKGNNGKIVCLKHKGLAGVPPVGFLDEFEVFTPIGCEVWTKSELGSCQLNEFESLVVFLTEKIMYIVTQLTTR